MASTVTIEADGRGTTSSKYVRRGTLNLGTYASGGVAVAKGQFELNVVLDELNVFPTSGYIPRWNKTTGKILVYVQKDPANAGGADIPLPEAGAIDLSAVNFRFHCEGV